MPARPADTLAELEFQMQFVQGKVVQLTRPYQDYTTQDLFVVTSNNNKSVSVAPLGGEGIGLRVGHRGLRIVEIDVARLKTELATA